MSRVNKPSDTRMGLSNNSLPDSLKVLKKSSSVGTEKAPREERATRVGTQVRAEVRQGGSLSARPAVTFGLMTRFTGDERLNHWYGKERRGDL